MKKEYRAELKVLARAERKINRDLRNLGREISKQINNLQRAYTKAARNVNRESARIDRRRAILEGRLS